MCLGIPGQIVEIVEGTEDQLALVDVMGVPRRINLGILDDGPPQTGEWILIHMGFAMERMTDAEAAEAFEGLKTIGSGPDSETVPDSPSTVP